MKGNPENLGSWEFAKAKFKVGERVRFPYGLKIGQITHVGAQIMDSADGRHKIFIGFLYRISSYTLTEAKLKRIRQRG